MIEGWTEREKITNNVIGLDKMKQLDLDLDIALGMNSEYNDNCNESYIVQGCNTYGLLRSDSAYFALKYISFFQMIF